MSQPKILTVTAKCSDLCFTALLDAQRGILHEEDGYVPTGLGIGGGDYVELEIDIETGQILNWVEPSQDAINKFMGVES